MSDLISLQQRQAEAERTVRRFVRRFEPSYHALACHAALPLVLTPELVNYLRNEFLRNEEVPWVAEVDLLLSDLCRPVGYELYAMDTDVRAYLLAELERQFGRTRIQQVAKLLISYVRYLAETGASVNEKELEAQQWAAMVYMDENHCQTAVRQIAEKFRAGGAVANQVGTALVNPAELARLAQITTELAPALTNYPDLLDYATLVSEVMIGDRVVDVEQTERSYEVLPGLERGLSGNLAKNTPNLKRQNITSISQNKLPFSLKTALFTVGQLILSKDELHIGEEAKLAFSMRKEYAATGDHKERILLWKVSQSKIDRVILNSGSQAIHALAFNPDGDILAVGTNDGLVSLWPGGEYSLKQPDLMRSHQAAVKAMAFSPDGKYLATGDNGGELCIWELDSGLCQRVIIGHSRSIHSLEYSTDGNYIISSDIKIARLWRSNDLVLLKELQVGFNAWIGTAIFLPDPNDPSCSSIPAIAGIDDRCLTIWSLETGLPAWIFSHDIPEPPNEKPLAISSNGQYLAFAQQDCEVTIIDIPNRSIIATFPEASNFKIRKLAFDEDSIHFAAASDQDIKLWNIKTRKFFAFLNSQNQRGYNQYYSELLIHDISVQLMQVPAGFFVMGSRYSELERQNREGPKHEVSLPTFFIGRYPVTQAQWRFVAGLPKANLDLNPNPSRFTGDTYPVEQISWSEAVEFCDRLSRHTGRPYRLPTEAEWEYACRANTTTPFHFGETITTDLANYNGADEQHGAYGRGPKGENRQTTTPVDHFGIANAFGLCDMHGNVWEWCQDPWRPTYGDEPSKRKVKAAPQPDQSTHRVARGGSWYTPPHRCRSASRIHFEPESRHSDLGFRVVCALEK